jgi:hypothetical protein
MDERKALTMANDPPYRVIWSPRAKESLKELGKKAVIAGTASELALLVRAVIALLERQPLSLGKSYRRRGGVEEHYAFQDSLGIDFAVDVKRDVVLIRACWSVPVGDRNGIPRSGVE